MIVNSRKRIEELCETALDRIKAQRQPTQGDAVMVAIAAVRGYLVECEQLEQKRGHVIALLFEIVSAAPPQVIDARARLAGLQRPAGSLLLPLQQQLQGVLGAAMKMGILPELTVDEVLGSSGKLNGSS